MHRIEDLHPTAETVVDVEVPGAVEIQAARSGELTGTRPGVAKCVDAAAVRVDRDEATFVVERDPQPLHRGVATLGAGSGSGGPGHALDHPEQDGAEVSAVNQVTLILGASRCPNQFTLRRRPRPASGSGRSDQLDPITVHDARMTRWPSPFSAHPLLHQL